LFFANARQFAQIPTLHLIAFTDGVAAQASARFEQFLAGGSHSRIVLSPVRRGNADCHR